MSARQKRNKNLNKLLRERGQPMPPRATQPEPDDATPDDVGGAARPAQTAAQRQPVAASIHRTRQQRFFAGAFAHIDRVRSGEHSLTPDGQSIYGGLCHRFPILIRTNGLCQAVALIEEKAKNTQSDRGMAYLRLRAHIAAVLGIDRPDDLLTTVASASVAGYQRYTRDLLAAWVFYKRFAVSMLGVENAEVAREDGGDDTGTA